jgi:hypothetical protein
MIRSPRWAAKPVVSRSTTAKGVVPGLVGAAGMAGAFQFPFLSGVVLLGMLVLLSLTAVVFAAARLRSHRG